MKPEEPIRSRLDHAIEIKSKMGSDWFIQIAPQDLIGSPNADKTKQISPQTNDVTISNKKLPTIAEIVQKLHIFCKKSRYLDNI